MHILEAAATLIEERGLQTDAALTAGPDRSGVTLHQALREAAGLHPEVWLAAYVDWHESTRNYVVARSTLAAEVVRRAGRPIEVTVWARQVDQDEVLLALAAAAAASPGADVPATPPVFRPGCNPSRKASVKYGGVIAAALLEAVRVNPSSTVAVAADAAAGGDLAGCLNEAFLDGLDELVARGAAGGEVGPDAERACRALLAAVQESSSRATTVLAQVVDPLDQQPPADGELADLLEMFAARIRAMKREQREKPPPDFAADADG